MRSGEFVESLLDNTTYISYSGLVASVRLSMQSFQENNHNHYSVYWPQCKFGSEHLMISQVAGLLKEDDWFQGFTNLSIAPVAKNILWIDDVVYTGTNIYQKIIYFTQTYSREYTHTVIVPYINEEGINNMARHLQDEKIDPPAVYFDDEIVSIYHIPEIKFTEKILQSFKVPQGYRPCPFFTDIKVANEFGSFPQIYLEGYVPCEDKKIGSLFNVAPSREPILQLQSLLSKQ